MENKRFFAVTAAFLALALLYFFVGVPRDGLAESALKGVPIVFLFLCACFMARDHKLIIFALLFSFIGDYLAELQLGGGIPLRLQISAFAVAQCCYIAEFLKYRPKKVAGGAVRDGGTAGDGGLMENGDSAGDGGPLGKGNVPCLTPIMCGIYGVLLLGNVVTSNMQRRQHKWAFAAGSILFLISDALVLSRVLDLPVRNRGIWIMSTYYLAQYLLNIFVLARKKA